MQRQLLERQVRAPHQKLLLLPVVRVGKQSGILVVASSASFSVSDCHPLLVTESVLGRDVSLQQHALVFVLELGHLVLEHQGLVLVGLKAGHGHFGTHIEREGEMGR